MRKMIITLVLATIVLVGCTTTDKDKGKDNDHYIPLLLS